MATLLELADLSANQDLRRKVRVACVLAAQAQFTASPGTPEGRKWALAVITDPMTWGNRVLLSVLANNAAATSAQITAATDTTIQNAVNAVASAIISANSSL